MLRTLMMLAALWLMAAPAMAAEAYLNFYVGPYDVTVTKQPYEGSDVYRATSKELKESGQWAAKDGESTVEMALNTYKGRMFAKGFKKGFGSLQHITYITAQVKELGGHGGSVKVVLDLPNDPFIWMEQADFPDAGKVEVGDNVTFSTLPNPKTDVPTVILFVIQTDHDPD